MSSLLDMSITIYILWSKQSINES